jgi:hypothetical protein
MRYREAPTNRGVKAMADENYVTRGQATAGTTGAIPSWDTEDRFFETNFESRPYATPDRFYEQFRPAYRYGFESASHSLGRTWDDAEPDLAAGWARYPHRGDHPSAWEEIKDAVKDAWDRVAHHRGAYGKDGEGDPAVRNLEESKRPISG